MRPYVFLDFETTGLDPKEERLTQVSAIKYDDRLGRGFYTTYINPGKKIPEKLVELIGITDEMVKDAPSEKEALTNLLEFIGDDSIVIAQNAPFDLGFLHHACERNNINNKAFDFYCTRTMSAIMLPGISHSLGDIVKLFDIELKKAHDAYEDANATAKLFFKLEEMAKVFGINFLNKLTAHPDRPMAFEPPNMIFIKPKRK